MHDLIRVLDRIPVLDLGCTTETKWEDWLMNFKTITAIIFDDLRDERKKVSALASKLLPSFLPLFKALNLDLDEVQFNELVVLITQYFKSVNARMTFYDRRQRDKETFEEFAKDLDALSTTCDYGSERLSLVRDMFIFNLNPKYAAVKKQILNEARLSLRETVDLAEELLKGSGALSDSTSTSSREPRHGQGPGASGTFGGRRSLPAGDVKSSGEVSATSKVSQGAKKGNRNFGRYSLGEMNGSADNHRPGGGEGTSKPNNDRRYGGGRVGSRLENEAKSSRTGLGSQSGSDVALKNRPPIPPGKFANVKVACVDEGIVHVCLEDDLEALYNIEDTIRNSSLRPVNEAKISFHYATKFKDFWCRVKILNVDQEENMALVLFYDWGNKEWVSISELMFLPEELIHLPGPLSFPIMVPSPEDLYEGDLLRVMLKEKDERGVWIAELKHSDGTGANYATRNQEDFGPADLERHGGGGRSQDSFRPKDGGLRPSGQQCSSGPNETRNQGKFDSADRESRQGGRHNADDRRGIRGKSGPLGGGFRPSGPNEGEIRNRGKSGPSNGGFRQGGPNADVRRNRKNVGPGDRERQDGQNDRDNDVPTESEPLHGGWSNDGRRRHPDMSGSLDSDRQAGRQDDSRSGHRHKFVPSGDSRPSGPSGRDHRHSSGSSNSASRQAADVGVPEMRNLSIDAHAPKRFDDTPPRRPHPPPIPSDKFTDVQVMWVGPEGAFATPTDKMDDLKRILREVVATQTTEPGHPKVGNIVAAPFENQVYRARILSVDPRTSTARLSFVDFGNEDDVPFDDLRALPAGLADPIYTFKFKLDSGAHKFLSDEDIVSVKLVEHEPDGAWLLQARDGPSDHSLPDPSDLRDDKVGFRR